jgi:hypothetical protein
MDTNHQAVTPKQQFFCIVASIVYGIKHVTTCIFWNQESMYDAYGWLTRWAPYKGWYPFSFSFMAHIDSWTKTRYWESNRPVVDRVFRQRQLKLPQSLKENKQGTTPLSSHTLSRLLVLSFLRLRSAHCQQPLKIASLRLEHCNSVERGLRGLACAFWGGRLAMMLKRTLSSVRVSEEKKMNNAPTFSPCKRKKNRRMLHKAGTFL